MTFAVAPPHTNRRAAARTAAGSCCGSTIRTPAFSNKKIEAANDLSLKEATQIPAIGHGLSSRDGPALHRFPLAFAGAVISRVRAALPRRPLLPRCPCGCLVHCMTGTGPSAMTATFFATRNRSNAVANAACAQVPPNCPNITSRPEIAGMRCCSRAAVHAIVMVGARCA